MKGSEEEAKKIIEEEAQKPFDLRSGPDNSVEDW